ncbi:MAG: hypothetical protein ACO2OO_02635 [Candidatus Aenigmatarchaeota archaeon]
MVRYPMYPPPGKDMRPGEGINFNPNDQNELLDYTTKLGGCTGVYYGLMFQLGKWGFQSFKVQESIFVSPINKGYYELVIGEKEKLSQQIKSGLASVAQAYADLELILHDLRKYREYVSLFNKIKKVEVLKNKKKSEEEIKIAEEEAKRAIQTLRSIFIDQVDIHTDLPNTPIALRSIASRWPTIISDFMKLEKETSPEEIKLDVSYAEKVVLATKNKLFLSWLEMFESTVKQRYERLKELAIARENSVKEYKEMLKPIIARYKMINDMLSSPEGRTSIVRSFFRPDAQAFSLDSMVVWAWKPFAPEEKWKASREYFDKIPAKEAGFTDEEIREIRKKTGKKYIDENGMIEALPIEPSIDRIVRKIKGEIEEEYKVKITIEDLFEARRRLLNRYKAGPEGVGGITWPFSPYFVFVEIPMLRTVLVLPDGTQIEDLGIENLKTYVKTQNIIIGHILEIMAREKVLENYISSLLGEFGFDKEGRIKRVEDILKEEFPFIYAEGEAEEFLEVKKGKEEKKGKAFDFISKILDYFGIQLSFFRAYGPYEHNVTHRIAKYYFKYSGTIFNLIKNYLNASFKVPGAQIEVVL